MQVTRQITNDITYVGVSDRRLSLFENIFPIPRGVSYNSYIINDEKTALIDAVDYDSSCIFVENVKAALNGKTLDYIVVNHMEPDHAGSLRLICDLYPDAALVATKKAVDMMSQFFGDELKNEKIVVKEGDTVSLGKHELSFYTAPMVHWPEVMVSYESSEKILFSADAFGKFGTVDADEAWNCEARRYYFNIVGKYGKPVQTLLGKAVKLDIATICPLHGPVLTDTIPEVIELYKKWSAYEPENEGVFIACASIHGNTWLAAQKLKEILEGKGCPRVAIADLTRDDLAEAVEDGFRHSVLVCMASSYDAGVFTPMEDYLNRLEHKAFQNRTVALVENASWAPSAIKAMKAHFEKMANITLVDKTVTIKTRLTDAYVKELEKLADEIMQKF